MSVSLSVSLSVLTVSRSTSFFGGRKGGDCDGVNDTSYIHIFYIVLRLVLSRGNVILREKNSCNTCWEFSRNENSDALSLDPTKKRKRTSGEKLPNK